MASAPVARLRANPATSGTTSDTSRDDSSQRNYIEDGRAVIEVEVAALQRIQASLESSFAHAVEAIRTSTGRLITTGLGKSGIVARKAASTFSSVGVPSVFLHPTDALHGDLGVLRSGDLVLALSYSGETEDVVELARCASGLDTTIIALVGKVDSSLGLISDITLDVSIDREACHLNLAPTASSLASLAMTDALAMVVSKARGVSAEDFARNHPAGSLGKTLLLRVDELMHSGVQNPLVHESSPMSEAVVAMTRYSLGAVLATDAAGRLRGIFTDGDLRRAIQRYPAGLLEMTLSSLMSQNPVVVQSGSKAVDALALMENGPRLVNVLPVVDEQGKAIGLVRLHDLVRAGIMSAARELPNLDRGRV